MSRKNIASVSRFARIDLAPIVLALSLSSLGHSHAEDVPAAPDAHHENLAKAPYANGYLSKGDVQRLRAFQSGKR